MYLQESSKVAFITFFIDIGRGDWEGWSNRTQENYFQYFSNMAHLENPIYIYIEDSLKSRILDLRQGRPTYFIESENPYEKFSDRYDQIKKIQTSDLFNTLLPHHLKSHPEYSRPDYPFVTLLKSHIVKLAIDQFDIKEDLVAWIDFGYKRDTDFIGNYISLPFPKDKITVFSQRSIENVDVDFSLLNNIVYIMGGSLVASKENWIRLDNYFTESVAELFYKNLVDHDQTIWLMIYLKSPELFNLIVTEEWFPLFKYNTSNFVN